jgi:hypothetical protein
MNKKSSLIIEVVWVAIGAACLYISVKEILNGDIRQAGTFLVMSVVSFLLAWFRDHQRKKL